MSSDRYLLQISGRVGKCFLVLLWVWLQRDPAPGLTLVQQHCVLLVFNLSPVAPVPASHLRCCILSYPAAGISTLLQVLQFLCHAWAVRSTQDVSFCLPDFCDKSVVILSIILFYAMHYFSLTVFFFFNSIFDFQLCDYHMLGCSSHRI